MTDRGALDGGPAAAVPDSHQDGRTNPRVLHALVRASRIAGMSVAALGIVVLIGWFTGLSTLTQLSPGFANMKFNAAVGLALVGLSIVALGDAGRPALARVGRIATIGYGALGVATLIEDWTGRTFGIDNPFSFEQVGRRPGRIAETTAVCFVAMALSVAALGRRNPRSGQLASMLVIAVACLAIVGYAFGVPSLYTIGAYSSMALHTAVAFLIAGLAVLCARPDEGLVALVTENSAGGETVRRMFVPAIVGPAVIGGLLDWAVRAGSLAALFGLAVFTVSVIVLTIALVWIIGSGLRHIDLRRAGAEDALDHVNHALRDRDEALALLRVALAELQSHEERFRVSVEHLHEALSVFTAIRDDDGQIVDFRWEFANSAASRITGRDAAALVGRTLLEVLPHHGPSGMLAIYRNVVETGEPFVEPSLWYEDDWGDGRRYRRAFDLRATKIGDGFVVVTREVTQEREHEETLARQRFDLERSNTEMRLLNNLADNLQCCGRADEAYTVVTQSCAALFPTFSGAVSFMHPSRDVLEVEGSWGVVPVDVHVYAPTDCWAVRRGRPYVSGPTGPRCTHLGGPTSRALCVPMVGPSEMMGVLTLISTVVAGDPSADLGFEDGPVRQLAVTVAAQMSMAFANLRLRDSLREMSIRDPLTGLFNRRYMEESLDRELSRAARDGSDVGVLVIDIDHFKAFNDTHGHEAGDAVLEAVGDVFRHYFRTSDTACRYGGEEFVVILPECSANDGRQRANELRRRIAALRVPFRNIELSGPTISCGVVAFPLHAGLGADLIRKADEALYAAKKAGRDQVVIASLGSASVGVAARGL